MNGMLWISVGSMFLILGISQNNPVFSIAAALAYAAAVLFILADKTTGKDE